MTEKDEIYLTHKISGDRAFPVMRGSIDAGMLLRDWFAGMAMQGILCANVSVHGMTEENVDRIVSEQSYALADEMIKARDK